MSRALTTIAALAVAWPGVAGGQSKDRAALAVAISINAAGEVPAWQARALEQTIGAELAVDDHLVIRDSPIETSSCPPGDAGCTAALYAKANVEVIMLGSLSADRLRYEVYVTTSRAAKRISRGSLGLEHASYRGLTQRIRDALDPAVRASDATGGPSARRTSTTAAAIEPPGGNHAVVGLLFGLLALFLATPLWFGAAAIRRRGVGRIAELRSFRITVAVWLGLAVTAVAVTTEGHPIASASWAVFVLGGLAWSWLVAVVVPIVFPSFRGLEQVEHSDVFRLTRAYTLVSLQRAIRTAVLFSPFALLLWGICRAVSVPGDIALMVLWPVWGLLVRFWFLSLVENLSLELDHDLVDGAASADNPWEPAVRGYFMGYVHRVGWPADDDLLDDILFLPGKRDGITVYGGGLTHSRVVISRALLEFAMSPYGRPHDYGEKREHKLLWSEWNAGLVVPLEMTAKIATPEERQPRHKLEAGETEHQPLGQPPTLGGFVEPDALDKRAGHQPTEDPLWLDWDPGDMHDGTDASDKDFLFGALVLQLGVIQRLDAHLHTLSLTGDRWLTSRSGRLRRVVAMVTKPYRLVFSRYPAIIGDAYAALNYARHHLIQYLAWHEWDREDLLTSRAYAPELEGQSTGILRILEREKGNAVLASAGPSMHDRLGWLSEFFREPARSKRTIAWRRAVIAGVVISSLAAAAIAVIQAVDYHPTYLDRMQQQSQHIDSPSSSSRDDERQLDHAEED